MKYRNYYKHHLKTSPLAKEIVRKKKQLKKKTSSSFLFSNYFKTIPLDLSKGLSSFFLFFKKLANLILSQKNAPLIKYYLFFFLFITTIPLLYTDTNQDESIFLGWVNRLKITKTKKSPQDQKPTTDLKIVKLNGTSNKDVLIVSESTDKTTSLENKKSLLSDFSLGHGTVKKKQLVDNPVFFESSEFKDTLIPIENIGDLSDDGLNNLKQVNPYLNENLKKKAFKFKSIKVKSGDSLWTISKKSQITIDSLISLNNLKKPTQLRRNQTLKIPPMSGIYHKVKKNESLFSISKEYRLSINTIKEYNQVDGFLKIGQTLFLKQAKLSTAQKKLIFGNFFIRPVNGVVSSKYGIRFHPLLKKRLFHTGIDIAKNNLSKVKAAASGTVIRANYYGSYGNYIEIKHAEGYISAYGHLNNLWVKKGQKVKQGQFIGLVGESGFSTGPHLHFEIKHNHKYVNPARFIKF